MATTDERLTSVPAPFASEETRPAARRSTWLTVAFLAAVSYVPLLFTTPGAVGADTKQYLYLDPGRLIQSAASMWDPNIGMGTVTHQNIGYLLPMGPFYWVFHHLGVPAWVAQRLWLGSLLFAASTGMLFVFRVLGVTGPGRLVGALAYGLSPYLLEYAARISAILMPWAGLPWMVGLVVLATRRGGWRYPALFALVVALVGGVNATSLLYAGVGPLLWIPYAIWVARETTWRRGLAAVGRVGLLSVAVSLWWAVGLYVQGGYGLDVLRYTETVKTVARTSLSSEVLRGLGYWFFYGDDKLGPWIQPAVDFTQRLWLLAISYMLPALAVLSAVVVRWRHRSYFVGLIVVGTALAVGPYPFNDPSPLGSVLKAFSTGSTVGLAMRSTGRAVPLVILGTASLLAVGVSALAMRLPRAGLAAGGVVGGLALLNCFPLFAGTVIGGNLQRPENVPNYWVAAANYLDTKGRASPPASGYDTRVLGVPGSDFASYRWGNTVDPILPGLMTRPYVARELFPYGTAGTVDLLNSLDSTLQEGTFVAKSLAPVARLMSAGDVLLQSDLQYERYNTPRPQKTWSLFNPPPPGLGPAIGFGKPGPSIPVKFPLQDETELAQPAGSPYPPPVAVFPVPGARSIVRTDPATNPLLVDGDGAGLVDIAGTGLLDTNSAVLYSPSMATKPRQLRKALASGADLVVTDTNRKQARRWSTVRENTGYTEQAGEVPAVNDPSDQRLPLFPGAGDNAYTVAQQRGVRSVVASAYGNPISLTPEDRPVNAADGDPYTSWTVGDFDNPVGQWLRINLVSPVTTDRVTLVQPLHGVHNRFITKATLSFDGRHPIVVSLGGDSRQATGQVVTFPRRTFSTLQITVDATDVGPRANYVGLSGVGFSEVAIANIKADEVIRLPEDLLAAAGASNIQHRLSIVMTRERAPSVPPRTDPETHLARSFELPTARAFSLTGTARLATTLPDDEVDRELGRPGSDGSGVVAYSSSRLPGDLDARASMAFDGNDTTAWTPAFGPQTGQWIEADLPSPLTFDHLGLVVLADGRHSVPTRIDVSTENGSRDVELPPVRDSAHKDATAAVPVSFPALTGRHVRITIEDVRRVRTLNYDSETPVTMPVGIAEAGIPGVSVPPVPAIFPATCRSDLLSLDGRPVPVQLTGTTADAASLKGLSLRACPGSDPAGIRLVSGDNELRSVPGRSTGINVDQVVLSSDPGGGPSPLAPDGSVPAITTPASPAVRLLHQDSSSVHLRVTAPGHPFWLVLGQSLDPGWTAKLADGTSLGPPRLVDGYANGWYVNTSARTLDVTMEFTPQRYVWVALALSAIGILACLAVVAVTWSRRRHKMADPATDAGVDGPLRLQLCAPWRTGGTTPSWRRTAACSVACGIGAGVLVSPLAGVAVALLALAALRVDRARFALSVGAVGLVAVTGLYVVVQQYRYHYPSQFEWPTFFQLGNSLVWMAVVLVGTDLVVEMARRGRPAGRRPG